MNDKELAAAGAKNCWNKFTRFLDKFTEIIFISSLTGMAIWNLVFMIIGKKGDKGFNYVITTFIIAYQVFLASLILMSWRGNLNYLTYFGFMRGKLSKALFLIFCGGFCFPGKYSSQWQLAEHTWIWIDYTVAIILIIAGVL